MRLIDADAAIDTLKELTANGTNKGMVFGEDAVHRIEMLPSAQPETNCSEIPNNSDTISRQQSIDTLRKMQTYKLFAGDDMLLIDQAEAQTELMMLPSAQPERIKGHWIAITSWNNTYKCSVCGRLLVNITDGKNKVAKNYPYCHCGADNRGKTE